MRSTLEIIIAVKDSQPVTHEELRLALLALNGIEHFVSHSHNDLIDAIEQGKPPALLKMKARLAADMRERLFQAMKKDPEQWLQPQNIPGNPEHDARLAWCKTIFEKATGEKL